MMDSAAATKGSSKIVTNLASSRRVTSSRFAGASTTVTPQVEVGGATLVSPNDQWGNVQDLSRNLDLSEVSAEGDDVAHHSSKHRSHRSAHADMMDTSGPVFDLASSEEHAVCSFDEEAMIAGQPLAELRRFAQKSTVHNNEAILSLKVSSASLPDAKFGTQLLKDIRRLFEQSGLLPLVEGLLLTALLPVMAVYLKLWTNKVGPISL